MAGENGKHKNGTPKNLSKEKRPTCGIVMPMSAMDGYSAEHWKDVRDILDVVIDSAGFNPNLVSNANEVTIIHSTIIENLYNNEIVICDVSGKNPNVMFELGMRVTFDKATIIIKDDRTDYNFDTSPIEHLTYPRDLRHNLILEFQKKLKAKLESTYEKSKNDKNYSPFIKHFGNYKIAHLEEKEISSNEFILKELKEIKAQMKTTGFSSSSKKSLESGIRVYKFAVIDSENNFESADGLDKFIMKNYVSDAFILVEEKTGNTYRCIAGFSGVKEFVELSKWLELHRLRVSLIEVSPEHVQQEVSSS